MLVSKFTDKKLGEMIDIKPRAVLAMKTTTPEKYDIIKIGVLCKLNNLSFDDVVKLIEMKNSLNGLMATTQA